MITKLKAMVPILVPLFISSFRRAYELANAMECRCYNGGAGRTKLKTMQVSAKDFLALMIVVICFVGFILLNKIRIGGQF